MTAAKRGEGEGRSAANTPWGVKASGPRLEAGELETEATALEVRVLWGEGQTLHVAHLCPPRPFVVGEEEGAVDFVVGSELLGSARAELVSVDEAGVCRMVPLACGSVEYAPEPEGEADDATSTVDVASLFGRATATVAAKAPSPVAAPKAVERVPGPVVLDGERAARVRLGGLIVEARLTKQGAPAPRKKKGSRAPLGYMAGVAAVFGMFALIGYFSPPPPRHLAGDDVRMDSRVIDIIQEAIETREVEAQAVVGDTGGPDGERAPGPEGEAGRPDDTASTEGRRAQRGNDRESRPSGESRETFVAENSIVSSVGASLANLTGPSLFDTAAGADPVSALGAMMGRDMGDARGPFGLGVRGGGPGGGGNPGSQTIGLSDFGRFLGDGTGPRGMRRGAPDDGGIRECPSGRCVRRPMVSVPRPRVSGDIDPSVIRRVVQRHRNEIRNCYQQGLHANPTLEGRVVVRFVISPTGHVSSSRVASGIDARVDQCVANAARRWSFPRPESGGAVGVSYPFRLTSGG